MAAALRNLQHAVNQSQEAIFISDPAGVIERVNPAFETFTGYSSLDLVGKDLSWLAAEGPMSNTIGGFGSRCSRARPTAGNLRFGGRRVAPCDLEC